MNNTRNFFHETRWISHLMKISFETRENVFEILRGNKPTQNIVTTYPRPVRVVTLPGVRCYTLKSSAFLTAGPARH